MANKVNIKEQTFNMANELMNEYHFKTLQDTKEILIYDNNKGIYKYGAEIVIEQEVQMRMQSNTTSYIVNEVLAHIRRSTYISHNDIDMSDNIINVKNGLLNAESMELVDHNPDYVSVIQLPVNYDHEASTKPIEDFIADIFNAEDQVLIKEFIGFLLIKRYLFHNALMITGDSGTGKTTLLRVISAFIGDDYVSSRTLQDFCDDKYASSDLYGKLANISDDLPANPIKYTGQFKQLTGESILTAQKKFKPSFTFYNNAKMIFSCNEIPSVNTNDEAYYARWLIATTKQRFTGNKANRNLIAELTTSESLSGLLNLALKYRNKLLKQNMFSYSTDIDYAMHKYQMSVKDSVDRFVAQQIELDGDNIIEKQKLYNSYVLWCTHEGIVYKAPNAFHRKLQEKLADRIESYYHTINDRREHCYKGITIKEGTI